MTDFLSKPIDPSHLIKVLRRVVSRYRERDVLIMPTTSNTPLAHQWPEIAGLDSSLAQQFLLGDLDLFMKTLAGLLDEHVNLVNADYDAINAGEFEAMREGLASQVHKLRSVSGMVGATQIKRLAEEAERELRHPVLGSAREMLTTLGRFLEELRSNSDAVLKNWRIRKNEFAAAIEHAPMDNAELQRLVDLLAKQDLSALSMVVKYSGELRAALGDENYQAFEEYLNRLSYEEAKRLIEVHLDKQAKQE